MAMKPIYFSYLPGAGGKSLINCLHLCSDVIFNEPVENFDTKFQRILNTVPDLSHNDLWFVYEIHNLIKGCDGPTLDFSYTYNKKFNDINGYLPLVTHFSRNVACYEKLIGDGIKIKIKPSIKWIDTAIRIKWQRSQNVPQPSIDLDQLTCWEQDVQKIKFDLTIEDFDPLQENRFDQHLTEILNYLGLKANVNSNIEYLKKYRNYHWSKIKQLNLTY